MTDEFKPANESGPKSEGKQPAGSLTIKLASFNRFGKGGDEYLVYQPKNKNAGARLVKGARFTVSEQTISQSEWNSGSREFDAVALSELKQLGIGV